MKFGDVVKMMQAGSVRYEYALFIDEVPYIASRGVTKWLYHFYLTNGKYVNLIPESYCFKVIGSIDFIDLFMAFVKKDSENSEVIEQVAISKLPSKEAVWDAVYNELVRNKYGKPAEIHRDVFNYTYDCIARQLQE